MRALIGFCGDAGAGKDSVADFVEQWSMENNHKIYRTSFAQPVYALAAAMLGTTVDALGVRKTKEVKTRYKITESTLIEMADVYRFYELDRYNEFTDAWVMFQDYLEPYSDYGVQDDEKEGVFMDVFISPRKALELIGTEFGRLQLHENVWLDRVIQSSSYKNADLVLITDVRFENEAKFVNEQGKLIQIVSTNATYKINSDHPSNQGVDPKFVDRAFVNTMEGLEKLGQDVKNFCNRFIAHLIK